MLQSDATITRVRAIAADQIRANDDATTSRSIAVVDEHGQFRNALAPRGGYSFGESGGRVSATVPSGQAIGTDPAAFLTRFQMPVQNPSQDLVWLLGYATTEGGAGLSIHLTSAGVLKAELYDAAGTSSRILTMTANAVTAYGGRFVELVFVRSAAGAVFYINGAAQAATESTTGGAPPAWTGTISGSFLFCGSVGARQLLGPSLGLVVFNRALSLAEVLEVYCDGVPDRFRDGSQVASYTADFSAGLDSWSGTGGGTAGVTCTGNIDTAADGAGVPPSDDWQRAAQAGTGKLSMFGTGAHVLPYGRASRVRGSFFIPAGSPIAYIAVTVEDNATPGFLGSGAYKGLGQVVPVAANAVTNFDFDIVPANRQVTPALYLWVCDAAGLPVDVTAASFYLKGWKNNRAGAMVVWSFNEGGGPQARDESANEIDGDVTSVVRHLIAAPIGARRAVRKTYAHSDISSTAGTTTPGWLPAGWISREVQALVTVAFDGGTTLDFGISGTAAKFVNALAVSTTGHKRADSLSLVPESATAATNLYVKKNQATTQGAAKVIWIIERIF